MIHLCDKRFPDAFAMQADADGGIIAILGKDDSGGAMLRVNADGGSVTVVGKDSKSEATLRPDAAVVKVTSEQRRWRSIQPPTIHWNQ